MLVVLEEWISPTWTYVGSDENVDNPSGLRAVGLVRTAKGLTPEWLHLNIPEETSTAVERRRRWKSDTSKFVIVK